MMILALESSATGASVALCQGDVLVGESFQKTGLTHSQTLLPMAEALVKSCGKTWGDIKGIAVAQGPGSFTGLRIGVSAAKGLSWGRELPLVGVSTLEAMAWNLVGMVGEICCAMDARRGQIYHARFCSDGETITRLTEDEAIALSDLVLRLENHDATQIVVGDGAKLCYDALIEAGISARLAPPHLRMQKAWGVAKAAQPDFLNGTAKEGKDLVPVYLRMSQAERERAEKLAQSEKE